MISIKKQKHILLTGASGFIGQEILKKLIKQGYRVRAAARNPEKWQALYPEAEWVFADLNIQTESGSWGGHLKGIETIINAAGIIRETKNAKFENVHHKGPAALFKAAAEPGIKNIIQISALGADETCVTPYHRSKKAADDYLLRHCRNSVILRPSIVAGRIGQSTALFSTLAALPVMPVPGDGSFPIQPVSVGDLTDAVLFFVQHTPKKSMVVDAAGPEVFTLKEWLLRIRRTSGFKKAPVIFIPLFIIRAIAAVGIGLLDKDTLVMLEKGSTCNTARFSEILGRSPESPLELWKELDLRNFLFSGINAVMRFALAFIWIISGVISAFIYPVGESFKLLTAANIPDHPLFLYIALYGASFLDIFLGAGVFTKYRSFIYLMQLLVIVSYTAILTLTQPEFWLHPFGAVSKNIPVAALIIAAFLLDQKKK